MPTLSPATLEMLRRLVLTDERVEVTTDTRPLYRERAAAGVMYPVSGLTRVPEANFRFSDEGWTRRHELLALPAGSP